VSCDGAQGGGDSGRMEDQAHATALTKNEIIVSGLKQGWLPIVVVASCGVLIGPRGSKPLSIDTPIKSVEFVRTSSTTPPQADRQPVSDPTHPSLRGTGSSNPSPSSAESRANFSLKNCARHRMTHALRRLTNGLLGRGSNGRDHSSSPWLAPICLPDIPRDSFKPHRRLGRKRAGSPSRDRSTARLS
jgi:hypothetical protein